MKIIESGIKDKFLRIYKWVFFSVKVQFQLSIQVEIEQTYTYIYHIPDKANQTRQAQALSTLSVFKRKGA